MNAGGENEPNKKSSVKRYNIWSLGFRIYSKLHYFFVVVCNTKNILFMCRTLNTPKQRYVVVQI